MGDAYSSEYPSVATGTLVRTTFSEEDKGVTGADFVLCESGFGGDGDTGTAGGVELYCEAGRGARV